MIGAVLDSNVLLSAAVGYRAPRSTPGALLRMWRAGAFDLITSGSILAEVERALGKPYFMRRVTPTQGKRLVSLFKRRGSVVEPAIQVVGVASHPEDDLVLATALSGHAQYLVTGDRALQALRTYESVTIVSPRAFLAILASEGEEP